MTHPDLELGDSLDAVLHDKRRMDELLARMVLFACRRKLELADAQDIVSDVVEKLLRAQSDPATAWKPTEKPMWRHIKGAIINEHRTWMRRRENRGREALGPEHEKLMARRPLVEEIESLDAAKQIKKLCADETQENLCWNSMLARYRGATTYKEIALACKCTVGQVRAARVRLLRRIAAVVGADVAMAAVAGAAEEAEDLSEAKGA